MDKIVKCYKTLQEAFEIKGMPLEEVIKASKKDTDNIAMANKAIEGNVTTYTFHFLDTPYILTGISEKNILTSMTEKAKIYKDILNNCHKKSSDFSELTLLCTEFGSQKVIVSKHAGNLFNRYELVYTGTGAGELVVVPMINNPTVYPFTNIVNDKTNNLYDAKNAIYELLVNRTKSECPSFRKIFGLTVPYETSCGIKGDKHIGYSFK